MIPVTLLEFHISTPYPLDFGAHPGSSIRGALYEALRTMYDTGAPAKSRHDDSNPVAWLLRLEDEATSGGKEVVRPVAVRPPLGEIDCKTSFGLSFYGRGRNYIPLVLSAVDAMQHIGIGRGRKHFTLERVDQVDPLSHQSSPLLDSGGEQIGSIAEPLGAETLSNFANTLATDRLTVQFLTPTRVIQRKKLCHKPLFRPWFQRLLERTRHISELYIDTPIWVPFKDLLAEAEEVSISEDATHWAEMWSGSRRDGVMRPTSGFVGTVCYRGDLTRLLPWLILGQALQVGKNTVKGCGWYRIRYQWR